ncbi:amino acid adenylation domain-containing protein [Streptomyces scopuliridis]|uniref:Amino acid adenylation domain-containing protein n=1 Tax=Streptomyces scopuliridis TaxID=452529 RepID=A0ACD4ZDC8_9ACTN|nr:amino acid adenylation domain-containing protein [Streptomyces scopuliridis]WSB95767.1 amino acid adenylation domain-containing protein [Streptomyces scopuliridis]WSC10526.1 amino acid adenylation domain-containing protein [Streptomyces scopuliridis]
MPGPCVHHLVEAQASLTPDAVAVVWDGGTLTYRELDERAARLANLLAADGVRSERLVGVAMEPSPQLLVTMLGVWKAGGVYVPVDPALPRGVAEAMLADAGAALLVRNGPATVDPSGMPVVDLDGLDLSSLPKSGPAIAIDPANLAYCVFTSGSTGKPKPVAVTHASIANHAVSLRDELKLGPKDRVLQFTAIAIDAALEEILPAWAAGAAVVMPGKRRFTSLEFTGLIDRHAVTVVSLPSAYWHQWVDDLTAGLVRLPACVRIVFIGGDKILVDKLAAWSRIPGAESVDWVCDYGPTETTISVALHRPGGVDMSGPDRSDYALVPIGLPFANSVIYLLDSDLRPVPDGTTGDIWVGGPPLARGYLAAPAATADRFLPDPQGPPGARMYRTGDRGSRRSDGTLVFLGRSDRQVKIRGHRVEPGQVESAVLRCAGVKDAVVVATEEPPFGSRLVAYVEAEPGVSEATIRTDLTGRVSEVMVPQSIVLLDRIPRSPLNGKVAPSALPPVAPTRADRTDGAGMTTLERVLASLAGDVFDSRPSRSDEDFFAVGGDSLRALQLLSRVAEVTGVALTFEQLRAAPNVAGIAALVKREHTRGASDATIVPRDDHGDRLPASRGQQALWFLDRVHRGAPTYAIPLCYRIRGPLDLDRLDAALTAIVARHEALRTVFEEKDGKVWQRIETASPVRTATAVVSDLDEASRRAAEEAGRPYDLTIGPLLRSVCFRVGAEEHLWLLDVHHAVFDAWSLAVFWRELAALYTGGPVPEPTTQFADYAAWQERWLRSAEADEQRAYWRAQLADDPTTTEPGSRREAGGRTGTEGFALELPPDAVDPTAVELVARGCGTTAFAVLLAAFFATLRRTGGVDEAVIGVPVACRNRPGTEDLIGYLVNTVPLRMRFSEGMRFRELIARTDEALAEALTNQELPFADVVDQARRGGGGHNSLFQAMFSLQSTPLYDHGDFEGLDITEQFVHSRTAKVALTWTMRQNAAGLTGEVEYAADRFDQASARRWQDDLLTLLTAGLAEPAALIDELPLHERRP